MFKRKLMIILLFLTSLLVVNYVSAESKTLPLLSKVIYLDPGHGGADSGAYYENVREADLNLEISKRIMNHLKKEGATIYLTRYDDYDLSANYANNRKRSDLSRRANVINKSGCDMYISIHLNAASANNWQGAQVYYDNINENNKKIAKIFQDEFKMYLNTTRNYKENNTKYMQHRINRPGVLLELGFLSNQKERYLLKQKAYQNKIADVVTKAIIKYYNS